MRSGRYFDHPAGRPTAAGLNLRRMWVIARKDLSDVLGTRSTYLYVFVMLLASISYFFSYFSLADSLTKNGATPAQLVEMSRVFLATIAYIVPVLYCFFACQTSISIVVLEKSKRTLESLMATPATIHEIWLGKSIAVTLSASAVGLGLSVFSYLVISLGEVAPRVHQVIGPPPLAIVTGLIVVPLLVMAVISLVVHLQLIISNVRVSNFIFVAVFLVLLGVLLFSVYSIPGGGLNQKFFLPVLLGLAIVVGAVSRGLSRRLTKEKVVLSSKE